MRQILTQNITAAVRDLCISANTQLGEDVVNALQNALEIEESPIGKDILRNLIINADIARSEGIPLCQDTGLAVVFMEIGQDIHVVGGSLKEAIEEGVRQGYQDGYLRKSTCDILTRQNRRDNTPPIVHFDIVTGDALKIIVVPKGGGSENMSRVTVFTPAQGIQGVKDFVVNRVRESGANPCPPTIIGIGLGGTIEQAALLAKKSLLRPLGSVNPDKDLAKLEQDWLTEINNLGIGPGGLGGRITSLAVHILATPSHIASIPVAVNIQCHSARHTEVEL